MKYFLDKLSDFFINLAVAAFAIALFQNRMEIMVPAFACLFAAIGMACIMGILK